MKKPIPAKLPEFESDEEIAAFMEKVSAFDLLEAGLAEIVPTPHFVRMPGKTRAITTRASRVGELTSSRNPKRLTRRKQSKQRG